MKNKKYIFSNSSISSDTKYFFNNFLVSLNNQNNNNNIYLKDFDENNYKMLQNSFFVKKKIIRYRSQIADYILRYNKGVKKVFKKRFHLILDLFLVVNLYTLFYIRKLLNILKKKELNTKLEIPHLFIFKPH